MGGRIERSRVIEESCYLYDYRKSNMIYMRYTLTICLSFEILSLASMITAPFINLSTLLLRYLLGRGLSVVK